MRNDFVESLNGHMRDEPLNETLFRNMAHARFVIREWAKACNEERPHSALGCQTPNAFAERLFTAIDSHAAQSACFMRLPVAPPVPIDVSTQRAPVPNG